MQTFALTVVDFDGEKISNLAAELSGQGYAVTTVSVSQSDAPAAAAAVPLAAVEAPADVVVAEQPFKCPACGATYATQVVCTNQHEQTQTLPTADVNAGTSPSADAPANGGAQDESVDVETGGADETSTGSDAEKPGPTVTPPDFPA